MIRLKKMGDHSSKSTDWHQCRLSRAKTADNVGIMEDGEFVETGSPQLLMNNAQSRFRRMLDLEQG